MGAQFLAMAGAQVVGGLITAYQTNRVAKEQERLARGLQSELDALEANRPEILNLSSQIQNQYSNLQVATQAAEFQAEESDISLANTLATARQTGLGAGGATALAQAALRSKRDISSSIEQQEARNILLRAQGAEKAQTDRIAQANREFAIRESRSMQALDRTSNLLDQANARAMANKQASQAALAGAIGAAAGAGIGSALGMGGTSKSAATKAANAKANMATVTPDGFPQLPSTPSNEQIARNLRASTSPANVTGGIDYNSNMTTRSPFGSTMRQAPPLGMPSMPASLFGPAITDYTPSFSGALGVNPDGFNFGMNQGAISGLTNYYNNLPK